MTLALGVVDDLKVIKNSWMIVGCSLERENRDYDVCVRIDVGVRNVENVKVPRNFDEWSPVLTCTR